MRAYNSGGTSAFSNVAEATTPPAPGPPAAPTNLTATAGPRSGVITLAWSDNSPNEDGFRIERCSGSSCTGFLQIAQVGAKATSFQNPNRRSGRWYRYRVRAFNAQDSGYSNIASATAP